MTQFLLSHIKDAAPAVDFWSARVVDTRSEDLCVRQNVLQPSKQTFDTGIMVSVFDRGGYAYAATSDLSPAGIKQAFQDAAARARQNARFRLFDPSQLSMPSANASYASPVQKSHSSLATSDKVAMLQRANQSLKSDERIVDWEASLWTTHTKQDYITSSGAHIEQDFTYFVPNVSCTAHSKGVTQSRSLHGRGTCRQAGLELLDTIDFENQAHVVAREALELVLAPNCPSGAMDVLLAPDQMMLQIHESIGHPLELDRILGDERNYAGTSFVTLDMFGRYQYGSSLLNITFDPSIEDQFASYAFDDDGLKAEKTFLIKDGVLLRPLGGYISQTRSGMPGVANTRACSWNRPPIDRMANLNLEPGNQTLDAMISSIERGVYMKSNTSWSIDDSRNKFQFGCEWAQMIENGKLTHVVRNPNYRGISESFWRSLKAVGDMNTNDVLGTPFCGKGEPNQCVRVGHASPTCLFGNVDVFGGE